MCAPKRLYVLELLRRDFNLKGVNYYGYGSALLKDLESCVRKKGAACIELQAVADEHHEHYYGKAGYHNAKNFVMKVKWFE